MQYCFTVGLYIQNFSKNVQNITRSCMWYVYISVLWNNPMLTLPPDSLVISPSSPYSSQSSSSRALANIFCDLCRRILGLGLVIGGALGARSALARVVSSNIWPVITKTDYTWPTKRKLFDNLVRIFGFCVCNCLKRGCRKLPFYVFVLLS